MSEGPTVANGRQKYLYPLPGCSHPGKSGRYATEREARRGMRAIKNPQGSLHPFLCTCGLWHLGHHDSLSQAAPARRRDRNQRTDRHRVRGGANRHRYHGEHP